MMKLPNGEQMRQIDQCAINEFKIPGMLLMENAGVGTVAMMERLLGSFENKFVPSLSKLKKTRHLCRILKLIQP